MAEVRELDLGPLTWVKSEIDQALAKARESLDKAGQSGESIANMQFAQTHLHQACGALSIVGLDGVTQFATALEQLFGMVARDERAIDDELVDLGSRALAAIGNYLEELVHGAPDQPLRLARLHAEIISLSERRNASAAELFYPDISLRPPRNQLRVAAVDEVERGQQIRLHRALYQRGLLKTLRNQADTGGARDMLEAATRLEPLFDKPAANALWLIARAFFEDLAAGRLPADPLVKRICSALDKELGRDALLAGNVPDRLMRELLYFIAISQSDSALSRFVRQVWQLDGLLPESGARVSEIPLAPLLKSLRGTLNSVKHSWDEFANGKAAALPNFEAHLSLLRSEARRLGRPMLDRLLDGLAGFTQWLRKDPLAFNDGVAIEVAAGQLLVESSLNEAAPDASFAAQVNDVIARLTSISRGEVLPAADRSAAVESARKQEERAALSQVSREIQSNLSHIEQRLDDFFRNQTKRAPLAALATPLKQIEGALLLIDDDQATGLIQEVAAEIGQLASSTEVHEAAIFESLAHRLSALGFYIQALEHGQASLQDFLQPQSSAVAETEEPSIEPTLADHQAVEPVSSEQATQSKSTQHALQTQPFGLEEAIEQTGLDESVQDEQDHSAAQPVATDVESDTLPSAQNAQSDQDTHPAAPQGTDATQPTAEAAALDAELLEIFIEEAHEVLETIANELKASIAAMPDSGHLTPIRRGFHTLKGSGRMVGLKALGDVAWEVEQTLNHWLQLEYTPTPALHAMVDAAHGFFTEWVAAIEQHGALDRDASSLIEQAATLRENASSSLVAAAPVASALPDAVTQDRAAEVESETLAPIRAMDGDVLELELETDLGDDQLLETNLEDSAFDISETRLDGLESAMPDQDFAETSLESLPLDFEPLPEVSTPLGDQTTSADAQDTQPPSESEWSDNPSQADSGTTDDENASTEEDSLLRQASVFVEALPEYGETNLDQDTATPDFTPEPPDLTASTDDLQLDDTPFSEFEPAQTDTTVPAQLDLDASEAVSDDEPIQLPSAAQEGAEAIGDSHDEEHSLNDGLMLDEPVSLESAESLEAFGIEPETGDFTFVTDPEALEPATTEAFPQEDADSETLEVFDFGDLDEEPASPTAAPLEATAQPDREDSETLDRALIGDVEISRPLLALYLEEATQHIARLHEDFDHLRSHPVRPPSEAALRAAHTLAGISGTARFNSVHHLAKALEHGLERLREASHTPSLAQLDLFDSVTDHLEEMVRQVGAGMLPLPAPEYESQLDEMGVTPPSGPLEPPPLAVEHLTPDTVVRSPAAEPLQVETAAPVTDELDEQLLPIFMEEAGDLLAQLNSQLREWQASSQDDEGSHATAVARLLHTLKGSARMTGAMTLGEQVHQLESQLDISRTNSEASATIIDSLTSGLDQIQLMIDAIAAGEPLVTSINEQGQTTPDHAGLTQADNNAVMIEADAPAPDVSGGLLRVRAETVDKLVNEAGEIGIARTRIEGELRTLRRSLLDLTENVIRLRNQLREVEIQADVQMQSRIARAEHDQGEFDPLEMDRYTRLQELTRLMAESVGDVTTVQQNLLRNLDGAELALHGQARMSRDLQQALMQIRMVPFDSLADRLYRVVRQSAKDLGKRVNLDIRGGRIEIDRSVLEHITPVLEHLLRNGVAHGIESSAHRQTIGKDEIGQITLTVTHEANEVVLTLADDGRGLDFDAIAARARERGLLGEDESADTRRLTNLIFVPGFSTAESLSAVSGRGVGMDVVKSETAAVGGRIDVFSSAGQGTQFRIFLPLTLAVTQAVLVRSGTRSYAIPSSMVAQVMELKTDAIGKVIAEGGCDWNGEYFAYRYLPQLLGERSAKPELGRFNWILLLRAGAQTLALHVDHLRGNQEIVVKNAGPQLTRIIGISGATVLGDGEIVLILNPVALASRSLATPTGMAETHPLSDTAEPQAPAVALPPLIMVVDDSLTVRKITGRLLEREGYRVLTAKDGTDALEKLLDTTPDVILSDIEMPRMDGFDLVRNLRADERLATTPVIMITSRLADKHRDYAMKVGANHYLGKPYEEDELLGLIRGYVSS